MIIICQMDLGLLGVSILAVVVVIRIAHTPSRQLDLIFFLQDMESPSSSRL